MSTLASTLSNGQLAGRVFDERQLGDVVGGGTGAAHDQGRGRAERDEARGRSGHEVTSRGIGGPPWHRRGEATRIAPDRVR